MFHISRAHRANYLCFALLMSSVAASAEPILIQEMSHMGNGILGMTAPETVLFRFAIYTPRANGTMTHVDWEERYAPNDVGMTFVASPAIVEGTNQAVATTQSKYLFQTGPSIDGGIDLGIPRAHIVTSVERIIDQLVISQPTLGGNYVLAAKQRIRIWGEPIPPLDGDFNQNGFVDAADYSVWRDRVVNFDLMPNGSGQGIFCPASDGTGIFLCGR
jgi:hypothetical protein